MSSVRETVLRLAACIDFVSVHPDPVLSDKDFIFLPPYLTVRTIPAAATTDAYPKRARAIFDINAVHRHRSFYRALEIIEDGATEKDETKKSYNTALAMQYMAQAPLVLRRWTVPTRPHIEFCLNDSMFKSLFNDPISELQYIADFLGHPHRRIAIQANSIRSDDICHEDAILSYEVLSTLRIAKQLLFTMPFSTLIEPNRIFATVLSTVGSRVRVLHVHFIDNEPYITCSPRYDVTYLDATDAMLAFAFQDRLFFLPDKQAAAIERRVGLQAMARRIISRDLPTIDPIKRLLNFSMADPSRLARRAKEEIFRL